MPVRGCVNERVLEDHAVLRQVLALRDMPEEGLLGTEHLDGAGGQSGEPLETSSEGDELCAKDGPDQVAQVRGHLLHASPDWQRGKISRAMGAKIAIAAKSDAYGEKFIGEELKKDLDRRVEAIRTVFKAQPAKPPRSHDQPRRDRGRGRDRGFRGHGRPSGQPRNDRSRPPKRFTRR